MWCSTIVRHPSEALFKGYIFNSVKPPNMYLRPWTSQVNIYQSKYGIFTDLMTVAHSTCSKTGSSHSEDKTPVTSNWQNGVQGFAKKGLLISDYRRNPSIFFLYHYLFLKVEIHTFDPQARVYSRFLVILFKASPWHWQLLVKACPRWHIQFSILTDLAGCVRGHLLPLICLQPSRSSPGTRVG